MKPDFRRWGWIIGCVASVALSANTQAVITKADWMVAGDELLLVDTRTGLEWLSHAQTRDLSYLEVLDALATTSQFEGFRVAVFGEIAGLFSSYGIPVDDLDVFGGAFYDEAESALIAQVIEDIGFGTYSFFNYTFYFEPLDTELVLATLLSADFAGLGGLIDVGGGFLMTDSFSEYGTWLVRETLATPVPEPDTLWLVGVALLTTAVIERRRKRPLMR
jgi:hypothetical protein